MRRTGPEGRTRMTRWHSGLVLALVTALAVSGCSDDEPRAELEIDAPPSASPTETTTGTDTGEVPEEPPASGLVRGLDPATTADEQAVTDAWFGYWTELTRMYTDVTLERTAFGELAQGQAYEGPVAYVERMQNSGNANQGGSIASVEKVRVQGDRATVRGCQRTQMVEMTAEGVPAELPVPYVRTRETLERQLDSWVVVKHVVLSNGAPCTYR